MMPNWFRWMLRALPNDQAMALWNWLASDPMNASAEMIVAIDPDSRWAPTNRCWIPPGTLPASEVEIELAEPNAMQRLIEDLEIMRAKLWRKS